LEQLHGDERLAGGVIDVINGANVRVIEGRSRLRFTAKALEGLGIILQFSGKEFERDQATQAGVLGLVDQTHAAAPQHIENATMGNGLAYDAAALATEPPRLRFLLRERLPC